MRFKKIFKHTWGFITGCIVAICFIIGGVVGVILTSNTARSRVSNYELVYATIYNVERYSTYKMGKDTYEYKTWYEYVDLKTGKIFNRYSGNDYETLEEAQAQIGKKFPIYYDSDRGIILHRAPQDDRNDLFDYLGYSFMIFWGIPVFALLFLGFFSGAKDAIVGKKQQPVSVSEQQDKMVNAEYNETFLQEPSCSKKKVECKQDKSSLSESWEILPK